MRMTQYRGFTEEAKSWLLRNCETIDYRELTRRVYSDGKVEVLDPRFVSELVRTETEQTITGMFDEVVHIITEFILKSGEVIEEYVQAEVWSGGPCIFMALRFKESKEPVKASLWPEKAIDNA